MYVPFLWLRDYDKAPSSCGYECVVCMGVFLKVELNWIIPDTYYTD